MTTNVKMHTVWDVLKNGLSCLFPSMTVAEKLTSLQAELAQAVLNRTLGPCPEPFWLSAIRMGGSLIQLFCTGVELGCTLSRSGSEFISTKQMRLMLTQFSTVDDEDSFDIVLMTMKGCKAPDTFITWMETEKKNIITACKDYYLLLSLTSLLIKTLEQLRDQRRADAIRDAARNALMSTIAKINENVDESMGTAARDVFISAINKIDDAGNGRVVSTNSVSSSSSSLNGSSSSSSTTTTTSPGT